MQKQELEKQNLTFSLNFLRYILFILAFLVLVNSVIQAYNDFHILQRTIKFM